jgi:zinc protease
MVPKSVQRLLLAAASLLLGASALAGTPKIETWHTSQGAKVMFVAAPDLPMVDVRMVFDAGSARDGALPGLAKLTNAVLDQGAGDWSADQIAERLEDDGVEIGNGALRDMAWYSVRSLTEPEALRVALETLAAVVAKPSLAEADVERTRQQMQIGLRRSLQSPGTVARRAFYRDVYGDHPYAHDPSGETESLARIGIADIKEFHHKYYVARNAVIAIVGALDRKQAEQVAEQLTAVLPEGEHAPVVPTPAGPDRKRDHQSFPSSQSHIYLGQVGMARHDPDYFPLYVGNHVLGGSGLVSTLGEEVRNKRGLSYSVYSYFSPMRASGPFVMVAQTKNEQAEQADRVMRETLQRFIEQGPSEAELHAAIQNITGGFPLRISSNKKIVEYIAMMGFYDYPLDWLDTMVAKVEAVTVEKVRDAFRRRVDPQRLVSVVVGGSAEPGEG